MELTNLSFESRMFLLLYISISFQGGRPFDLESEFRLAKLFAVYTVGNEQFEALVGHAYVLGKTAELVAIVQQVAVSENWLLHFSLQTFDSCLVGI